MFIDGAKDNLIYPRVPLIYFYTLSIVSADAVLDCQEEEKEINEILIDREKNLIVESKGGLKRSATTLVNIRDKQREAVFVVGLPNQGNTCYINAFLQCLLASESYIGWIYDFIKNLNIDLLKDNLDKLRLFFKRYFEFFYFLEDGDDKQICDFYVNNFLNSFYGLFRNEQLRNFIPYQQCDANELFIGFRNKFNEFLESIVGVGGDYSWIVSFNLIFRLSFTDNVKCVICCQDSSTIGFDDGLIVHNLNALSVQDALFATLSERELVQFACEKCKNKGNGIKTKDVQDLPTLLSLLLSVFVSKCFIFFIINFY